MAKFENLIVVQKKTRSLKLCQRNFKTGQNERRGEEKQFLISHNAGKIDLI